jgi:energy-coupling factor transporter ATP-binding protein EcfA2
MSGGERRRVALAWLLVEEPALAILDEPIIQLDADTIAWLKRRESGLTALLGTRVPDSGSMDATLARARLAWGAMRVI